MQELSGKSKIPHYATVISLIIPQQLRDRDADPVTLDDDFAFCDRPFIGQDQHGVVLSGIQLNDRATAHAQQLVHGNDGPPENNRDFNLDACDIGSHLPCRTNAA